MLHQELAPGVVIASKYVVERSLGHGGMGAVYVVSHAHTGKRMAMKVLLPEFVANAEIVSRFMREAQVMGRLHHRHVVDVFDVGRDNDVLFIVMELLEGKPLSDLLADTTLTLEEALTILMRTMEGVAAAHDQGVVHRDLKPDNIFVCVGTSGRLDDPRVLDFGISKIEDPRGEQLTVSGVAMGTPYYMSIEQLSGQRDLDARVDVYAMGIILYEAIAGDPPYVADSMSALAVRVLTTEAMHLGKLRPDLPPGLADLVMKAIARNRDERPRSMRAFIEALRPFLVPSAGLAVPEGQGRLLRTPHAAQVATQPQATPTGSLHGERLAPRAKSRAGLWIAAALVVALAAAGTTVVTRQPSRTQSLGPVVSLPALPAVQEPEPAVAPVLEPVKPTAVAAPSDAGHALPEPAVAEPVQGHDQAPEQGAKREHRPRGAKAKPTAERPTIAPQAVPQTPPGVAPVGPAQGAAARRTAEGRAGKLGSDEF